jgi:NAD-dependent deacetylase sirtuin 4
MVRISIPTIKAHPSDFLPSALTLLPVKEAAQHLSEFLQAGKGETLVLTGAGVSVDSGIRAYRGKEGHYSNPNYTYVRWVLRVGGELMVGQFCIMN